MDKGGVFLRMVNGAIFGTGEGVEVTICSNVSKHQEGVNAGKQFRRLPKSHQIHQSMVSSTVHKWRGGRGGRGGERHG